MKITKDMIVEFNEELAKKNCVFRYEFDDSELAIPCAKMTLVNLNYVNSFIVNLSNEFFDWLVQWFEAKGIKIMFNNDRSIFWSMYN